MENPPPRGPILWSILVPTIPGREGKLHRLLAALDTQVGTRKDVELLVLRDSRHMTIGEKRNKMVSIARGDYVTFIDDDDMVASDYVSSIAEALAQRPDVVVFLVRVEGMGPAKTCRYGIHLGDVNLPQEFQRRANHLMAWRRDLAECVEFPSADFGEDSLWAVSACQQAESEHRIDRVLYIYQFDPRTSVSASKTAVGR